MADTQEITVSTETGEKPTTHSKKAQYTAIALVVLVVVGLILNGISTMNSRKKRDDKADAELAKQEANAKPRAEVKLADFAAKQEEAAGQLTAAEKAQKEVDHKSALVDKFKGEGDGTTPQAAQAKKTVSDITEEFALIERKRVLDAMAGKIGRTAGGLSGGAGAAGGPAGGAPQTELAKVEARIAALTAAPAAIEQKKRELLDRASATGLAMPDNLSARLAGNAGGAVGATAQNAALPTTGASFGELAGNRVARDPSNSGPMPGEKILPTGTIISAVLDQDMMSDYVGDWIAVVQRPVYDVEMENILIPAGTKITGKSFRASGVNESIQNRMGSTPLWAIRQDGKRIDFKKTSATDSTGIAAFKDVVDRHFLAQFFGVGAYAVIGLGPSTSNYGAEPNSARDAFVREATGKSRDIGRSFAEKYLNIVPTITIRAGKPMKIFIQDDIYIKPWEEIDASHFVNP